MCEYKSKFATLASVSSNIRPQRPQGVGSHLGADKGINTSFFETVVASDLFLALRLAARFVGTDKRACPVRLQEAYAPMAMVSLLTSIIETSSYTPQALWSE